MTKMRCFTWTALAVFAAAVFCQTAGATQRGAKSLFYDPNAAATVQIAEPGAEAGGSGTFTPSASRMGSDGNPVNPVSNYYDNLNPGVMYWIEMVRPGSGMVQRVSNDRVFRSGDRIRIHVTTNSDGYLHVLHGGSTGSSQIIPVSTAQNGAVQMGQDYVIPPNGGWLKFDNNPGKEKLKLVFASIRSPSDVVSAMQQVSVQNASTAVGQLTAIYSQYQNSPNYIRQMQSGSKDLIMVGAQAPQQNPYPQAPQQNPYPQAPQHNPYVQAPQHNPYYQPQPAHFNTGGMRNYQVDPAIYNAPASYVVSQSTGAVKEPVVIEIALNHHP